MFSRTRANRIMIGAAGLFMVTALPACSFFTPVAEPTFSELTGVWGNGETRLTLKNDDTFTLEDAPTYTDLFRDEDWQSWTSETYDSAGEWKIVPDTVWLQGRKVYIVESSGESVLEFGIDLGGGDPRCFQLVREGSDIVPKGPENCFVYG